MNEEDLVAGIIMPGADDDDELTDVQLGDVVGERPPPDPK